MPLPVKQRSAQHEWTAELDVLRAERDRLVEPVGALVADAAHRITRTLDALGATRPAFGWSGGKDSQALHVVCRAAGIDESMLAISDLEYPAFLAWATDNMPAGLTVVRRPWDLDWLCAHPEMLFPANATVASKWFAGVQHWGQRRYCDEHHVDVLLQGRRRADGNYIAPDHRDHYRDRRGFWRYSPLADWTHEHVLAVLVVYGMNLAPCYGWPRGFQVGTGSWPARQWCTSVAQGWAEVDAIDPHVVAHAATRLDSAAAYLARR